MTYEKPTPIDRDDPVHMCAVMRLVATLKASVNRLGSLTPGDVIAHGSVSNGTVGIVIGGCRIEEQLSEADRY